MRTRYLFALAALPLAACTGPLDSSPLIAERSARAQMTVQPTAVEVPLSGDLRATAAAALLQLGDPALVHATLAGPVSPDAVRTLRGLGIPEDNIRTSAGAAPALTLTRYQAVRQDCQPFGDLIRTNPSNAPVPDFGCATTQNLLLMVEDPRDLLVGRGTGPADGAREAAAVERYRTDKVKPLPGQVGGDIRSIQGSK